MSKTVRIIIGTALLVLWMLLLVTAMDVGADQATCPQDAPWVKIDSDDLSLYPVAGAVEYCFKAGSDQSQGCVGGLFDTWPQPEGTCGLSHWSYRIGKPDATPTETEVPTATATPKTPTATATQTPTGTLEPTSTPTLEPTPNQLTETPDIACRDKDGKVIEGCHYGKG